MSTDHGKLSGDNSLYGKGTKVPHISDNTDVTVNQVCVCAVTTDVSTTMLHRTKHPAQEKLFLLGLILSNVQWNLSKTATCWTLI